MTPKRLVYGKKWCTIRLQKREKHNKCNLKKTSIKVLGRFWKREKKKFFYVEKAYNNINFQKLLKLLEYMGIYYIAI